MERHIEKSAPIRERGPRRSLLVAIASGQMPPWYLRQVFDLTDTEVRRALVEATHIDVQSDS
jgi:hypothetical protein